MGNNNFDVFISYSRRDTSKVMSIVDKLTELGISVWIDKDGIESGDAFKSIIVKAIKQSTTFLFFSSKNSNESPWTVKEVNVAVHLKKTIIPVKLDETIYSDSILFDLGGIDYVDLSNHDSWNESINKLIVSLESKLKHLKENIIKETPAHLPDSLSIETPLKYSEEELREINKRGDQSFDAHMYAEAFDCYLKSAGQDDPEGQYKLGYMYEKGLGVVQDFKKAVTLYREVADKGFASGQYSTGVMYDRGYGVSIDKVEAARWYTLAAEQGHPYAQFNLGYMYKHGYGVPKDIQKAIFWYGKAGEQGHTGAQFNLGMMYKTGIDVEKDYNQAKYWLQKAASRGDKDAIAQLQELQTM